MEFEPLIILGRTKNGAFGVKFVDVNEDKLSFIARPENLSGFCMVLYHAIIDVFDGEQQIQFEKDFKKTFDYLFENSMDVGELMHFDDEEI
jgi:hypothetical protein